MKRILFVAAFATLLAAGCQKTEIINPVSPTGEPSLSFTTGMGKLTKAEGTAAADAEGMVNLQAQDFIVWTYADFEDELNGKTDLDQIYDEMGPLSVTYSNGSWGTELDYYWPGKDKFLRFFAVSGVEADKVTPSINRVTPADTESEVAPQLVITDFVANTGNVDLMVADFVHQSQNSREDNKRSVDLNFRHTLSKVEFLFKTEVAAEGEEPKDVVLVQKVTVADVKTTSTLTVVENPEDGASTPIKWTWAEPTADATQDFVEDFNNNDKVANESEFPADIQWIDETAEVQDRTALKLTGEAQTFATWLVMPQNLTWSNDDQTSGALTVDVLYLMGKRQMVSTFVLNTVNLTRWGENQYVKYTITLTPNKISFVPSVSPWEPQGGTADDGTTTEPGYEVNMGN